MGLCFSVPTDRTCNLSLKNIFKALRAQFEGDDYEDPSSDLSRWAEEEGVLLLNASLTVLLNQPGSHTRHWAKFTTHVMEKLKALDQPIVWMLWGKDADRTYGWNDHPRHLVLRAPHPSPQNGNRFVDHEAKQRSFVRANDFLREHGVKPVEWLLKKQAITKP